MQKQLADIGGTDAQHVANDEAGVELSGLFVRSSPSFIDKVRTNKARLHGAASSGAARAAALGRVKAAAADIGGVFLTIEQWEAMSADLSASKLAAERLKVQLEEVRAQLRAKDHQEQQLGPEARTSSSNGNVKGSTTFLHLGRTTQLEDSKAQLKAEEHQLDAQARVSSPDGSFKIAASFNMGRSPIGDLLSNAWDNISPAFRRAKESKSPSFKRHNAVSPAALSVVSIEESTDQSVDGERGATPRMTRPVDGERGATPRMTRPVDDRFDGERCATPRMTRPVDGERGATPRMTRPVDDRFDGERGATPRMTRPVDDRFDGERGATPRMTRPVDDRFDGERDATPQMTRPVDGESEGGATPRMTRPKGREATPEAFTARSALTGTSSLTPAAL